MELYFQKHNAFVTFDQYKKNNNYKKRANSINLYSLRSPFIKHIATSFNDEEKGRWLVSEQVVIEGPKGEVYGAIGSIVSPSYLLTRAVYLEPALKPHVGGLPWTRCLRRDAETLLSFIL